MGRRTSDLDLEGMEEGVLMQSSAQNDLTLAKVTQIFVPVCFFL